MEIVITTFYKFIELPEINEIRVDLVKLCNKFNIKGTILLAHEGINATVSGNT